MSHPSEPSFVLPPPVLPERVTQVTGSAVSPDTRRLAVVYKLHKHPEPDQFVLRVWTLADRSHVDLALPELPQGGVCWSTPETLVVGGKRSRLLVVPVDGGPSREIPVPDNKSYCSAFAPVPGQPKVALLDGELLTVDLETGAVERTERKTYGEAPLKVAVAPDGDMVVTQETGANYVRIWSRAKAKQKSRLQAEYNNAFALSADGRWLAYGPEADGRLIVLERKGANFKPARHIDGAQDTWDLGFSPDSALLVSVWGAHRPTRAGIRVWDFATGALRWERKWSGGASLCWPWFAAEGSLLTAGVYEGGEILVWETASLR